MTFNKKNGNNTIFDIVVIGAGPTGIAFACGFANTKIKIAIIDKLSKVSISNPKLDGREIALTHQSIKILRKIDDVYLIDSLGNILLSDVRDITEEFVIPTDEDYDQALDGKPVFITDSLENKTTVMTKLNSLVDTYLYISRNIDSEILRYLNETEQAVSFYYSVENSQTGIKVTFAIIYIIVVTLLLFLSTSIAITFASRFTKPIINLIGASDSISKGALDVKVPEVETDEEFKQLNQNFNQMIERLKEQQDKQENLEFLELNLLHGHKCRKSMFKSKLFKVGTDEYRDCVFKKAGIKKN